MDMALTGKVVVVTGATANIGRAIALAFAKEGARIVVVGRDEKQGRRVCELSCERGATDTFWRRTDVLQQNEVQGLFDDVFARFGAVDVLVNNVGGNTSIGPFACSNVEQWRADIELTLMSTLLCTRAVLPHMLERRSGRIINIGSTSGLIGDPLLAVYSAAKGAIHAFTRVLALEVGAFDVTVNAIAPYATIPEDPETETSSGSRFHPTRGIFTQAWATMGDELARTVRTSALERRFVKPAEVGAATALDRMDRRFVKPAEVGAAAVYLASEYAGFITGQILYIEGGVLLV